MRSMDRAVYDKPTLGVQMVETPDLTFLRQQNANVLGHDPRLAEFVP